MKKLFTFYFFIYCDISYPAIPPTIPQMIILAGIAIPRDILKTLFLNTSFLNRLSVV